MTNRETYIAKVKLQIDELNAKMAVMEGQAKVASAELRDSYRTQMDKLRESSKVALGKFDELGRASESTWETMTAEMDKVRDAFKHSFKDFKDRL